MMVACADSYSNVYSRLCVHARALADEAAVAAGRDDDESAASAVVASLPPLEQRCIGELARFLARMATTTSWTAWVPTPFSMTSMLALLAASLVKTVAGIIAEWLKIRFRGFYFFSTGFFTAGRMTT